MEPLPRETPTACPHIQIQTAGGSEPLPTARYVTVVFKERRYDDGAHKTWLFANIDHVAIVNGRLQLAREHYGIVCDIPYEEVEQVYAEAQKASSHMAHAKGSGFSRHLSPHHSQPISPP